MEWRNHPGQLPTLARKRRTEQLGLGAVILPALRTAP